jgi:cyclophilin family peptidyl-prolyl cis-trans isomerase/protein-disulfide isomerase
MRNLVFLILSIFLISACTSQPSVTQIPGTLDASPAAKPISTNLGKCVDARQPTPEPGEASLFPVVNDQDHIFGKNDAGVTILVYSDFQCTSCAQLSVLLNSFLKKYPRDLRLVFRHFPLLSIHNKAEISALAAEAAALQGKFWEMHDLLFSKQAEWQLQEPEEFQSWIIQQAPSIQVDAARLSVDMSSPALKSIVQKGWDDGLKIKLPGVPVILINGEIIKWQTNLLDQLESFVKLALLSKKQFGSCPELVIDRTRQYYAILKTSKGDIRIKLFQDKAPNTVNNFIFLSKKGWFDNNSFYRSLPGSLVQTGDPSGTGLGGPGYFIPSEENSALLYDRAGIVGMVNLGPDTNGSQFLITLAPSPKLNHQYPIFGEVVSGMDILAALKPQEFNVNTRSSQPDVLLSVSIEAK